MLEFKGPSLPKTDKKNKQIIEPVVIAENLIIQSVRDYNFENKIIASDTVLLQQLRQLTLSFKNIWKIENLQGLEKLEKLQLDNNIIQKIENIGHLVHLQWLDLSFNAIAEIQGLDTLILHYSITQITTLKGLDNCRKLNVFSIGNNKIPSFEIITTYFSKEKGIRFKNLQVLNVAGNPFTKEKESEYKNHIINQLPNLRYIDYQFIDENQRNQIRESDEKFRSDQVSQDEYLKHLEGIEEDEKKRAEEMRKMKSANMDLVEDLIDELIKDEELEKVKILKGVEEEIVKFQEKIKETVENLQKLVIAKNGQKLVAIDKFEQAVRQREAQSERETIETLRKFEHTKKLAFRAKDDYEHFKKNNNDRDSADAQRRFEAAKRSWRDGLEKLREQTFLLKDNLLYIEHQIMVDIESSIQNFDSNQLSTVAKEIQELVSGDHGFRKIGEAVKEFGTKLLDIAKTEFDRYVAAQSNPNGNQDVSEWDDENGLFENKETLLASVGNIKENLSTKAVNKESSITIKVDKDIKALTTSYRERQYERNRKNVVQIHKQIEEYRKLIDEKLEASDEESDG
ncbi:hypothetical protein pb186bvf_003808 [Paramecium bursaria]